MVDTPLLKIPLLSTSQSAKETTINSAISALERAMNDQITLNFGGGNFNLTETDLLRYFLFKMTAVGATSTLNIVARKRLFSLDNLMNASPVTLSCGTDTLTIPVGGIVIVYCDGVNLVSVADSTIMGSGGASPTTFISLLDTPVSYADLADHVMVVNTTVDALEGRPFEIGSLTDVDLTGLANGFILKWDATALKWEAVADSGGGSGSGSAHVLTASDAATILPLSLNDDLVIGTTIDSYTLILGSRILVKDQTDLNENGIWEITATLPIRPVDASDLGSYIQGSMIPVLNGTVNGLKIFIQTEPPLTPTGIQPGITPLVFQTNAMSVADLNDTNLASLNDGFTLVYNSSTEYWESKKLQTLPVGGTFGQIIRKNSSVEGDASWVDPSGGAKKEIAFFAAGKGRNAETVCAYASASAFIISAAGSSARAVVAATSETVYTLTINATVVGTVTFAAAASIGVIVFTAPGSIPENGIFTVEGPALADGTLADFHMTFKEV